MAVKTVKYSRTFLSRTTEVDRSHHAGSYWGVKVQEISEEDEKIRKEMEHDFGFYVKHIGSGNWNKEIFGSDDRFLYSFRFSGHPREEENPEKNVKYQTEVRVRKSSSIVHLNLDVFEPSDLERFLVENKFQRKD